MKYGFGIFLWMVLAASLYAQSFPYTATVCDDTATIHCGPGRSFYVTDSARSGDTVEVYKHTLDGWCAIRPPAGSFSWVAARYVQTLDTDLGEISSNRAPCYVGSRLTGEKSFSQIEIPLGRKVEILESPTETMDAWYRIAPPSGEFRYIHGKFLTPNRTGVTELPQTPQPELASTIAPAVAAPASPIPPVNEEGTFEYHYQQMDADLSYILAGSDATQWETQDLLLRVNRLMNRAESVQQRKQVETLRQKILEADRVRKNKLALREMESTAWNASSVPLPKPPAGNPSRIPAPYSTTPGRWDYQGFLVRVQPQMYQDLTLPRYALVDEKGLLRCFVSSDELPLPDYEGRLLTLAGTRTYLKDQRAFHLHAKLLVQVGERMKP